jgi:hypothetical protein
MIKLNQTAGEEGKDGLEEGLGGAHLGGRRVCAFAVCSFRLSPSLLLRVPVFNLIVVIYLLLLVDVKGVEGEGGWEGDARGVATVEGSRGV